MCNMPRAVYHVDELQEDKERHASVCMRKHQAFTMARFIWPLLYGPRYMAPIIRTPI